MNELVLTAYHEAGHAFVSYCFGKGFKEVTIIASEDYLGAVTNLADHKFLGSLIEGSNSYILPEEIIKMRINHELMILYAGYLSEFKYGVANEEGAYSDLMVINSFIKAYSETEEESKNIIEYCYNTTIKILEDNWLYLRILANELLKKDTLSFQEIDELLKNVNFNSLTDLREFESQLK